MRRMFEGLIADTGFVGDDVIRLAGDGGWAKGWPMIALCQFDLTRFAGDVVTDALRSHPLCIMGTVLVHNSLHEDPAQLLQELAERS